MRFLDDILVNFANFYVIFSKRLFGKLFDFILRTQQTLTRAALILFYFQMRFFIRDQCDILPGNAGIPSRLSVFSEAQERDRAHSRFEFWEKLL